MIVFGYQKGGFMKNLSRNDLQERAGMWDLILVCFFFFIVFGFGETTFLSGNENSIPISRFGSVVFMALAVFLAIRCWRAKRALKRIPHEI
jgi:hypothetical protein